MPPTLPLWIVRLLWLSLPVTLGELLAEAVAGRSDPVRWSVAAMAWGAWAAGLAASVVPSPASLVVLRVLAPAAPAAGLVAALLDPPGPLGWAGLASALAVAVLALSAEVGAVHLDAASYGDERRMPLRPPAVLLLGPIPLLWAAMTVLPTAGVLACAAGRWVLGVPLLVLGAAAVALGARSLSRLTRRWLVFVPAGVTLVDDLAIVQPTLLRRNELVAIGPAEVGTDALDLSVAATGLLVQVDLANPVELTPVVRRGEVARPVSVTSLLVAPSRPGALLQEAVSRRLRVTTAPPG